MIIEACILGLCVLAAASVIGAAITNFTNQTADMYAELVANAEAAEKAKTP